MAVKITKMPKNKLALVKLDKRNNVLYSEYIRVQKQWFAEEDLIQLIVRVLDLYKNESPKKQAKKIIKELLNVGGINEQ